MPCNILVVEDNFDCAESLRMLLEVSGHRVAMAYDGVSAMALLRQERPDVVLCDIGLPGGMDGYEVARAIRDDPRLSGVYLVAMTGYGQEEDRERARQAGFDVHLVKPVDPRALERLLQELSCGKHA
jgi:CheY-like chemotaxis protein